MVVRIGDDDVRAIGGQSIELVDPLKKYKKLPVIN